jgi:hypothetical protein
MFRLDDQNTALGGTSSIEVSDGINQGGIHAEAARKRNIENLSIKQTR